MTGLLADKFCPGCSRFRPAAKFAKGKANCSDCLNAAPRQKAASAPPDHPGRIRAGDYVIFTDQGVKRTAKALSGKIRKTGQKDFFYLLEVRVNGRPTHVYHPARRVKPLDRGEEVA